MKKIQRNENSIILTNELQDFKTGRLLSIAETQNFVIIQVADSFFGGGFVTPAHTQECDLEITYSLTNRLFCSTDGIKQKIEKNEAYLSYKGDIHELSGTKGCRFKTLAINIKEGQCTKLFNDIKTFFKKRRKCELKEISDIISQVVSEISFEGLPFSLELIDSLIVRMLVALARTDVFVPKIDALSLSDTLPSIMNYIDSNFLDIYSADELAAHFGYDYGHICKMFKKCYGISPGKYLSSKKLDYAAELLKKGESVKSVSEKLNYSTPYNFSRAFKSHFGKSPLKYTKQSV